MLTLILGILIIVLLFFNGWVGALIGPAARYIYFGLGFAFGYLEFSSALDWLLLGLSLVVSFWVFIKADKRIKNGDALSHIPHTITLCQSAYFFGLIFGLAVSMLR